MSEGSTWAREWSLGQRLRQAVGSLHLTYCLQNKLDVSPFLPSMFSCYLVLLNSVNLLGARNPFLLELWHLKSNSQKLREVLLKVDVVLYVITEMVFLPLEVIGIYLFNSYSIQAS